MEVKLKGGCGFEVRPSFTLSTVLNVKEASVTGHGDFFLRLEILGGTEI